MFPFSSAVSNPRAATAPLLAGLGILGLLAHSAAAEDDMASYTTEQLITVYLDCERAALSQRQDQGEIMLCSLAYETLKMRSFGGDFHKMREWTDTRIRRFVAPDGPRADDQASGGDKSTGGRHDARACPRA